MTAYLMALDDRISVAAPSCYITSLERLFATIGPQDAEQNITGQVAAGMEHADYVTMRAPKPTSAHGRHPRLLRHPGELGHVSRSQADLRPARASASGSTCSSRTRSTASRSPRRVATARWMRRWLLKQDDAVDEPDFPIATDAELQCTRTGQVLTDFKDVSVFDLNRRRDDELRPVREAVDACTFEAEAFRARLSRSGLAWLAGNPARCRFVSTMRFCVERACLRFWTEPLGLGGRAAADGRQR